MGDQNIIPASGRIHGPLGPADGNHMLPGINELLKGEGRGEGRSQLAEKLPVFIMPLVGAAPRELLRLRDFYVRGE